MLANEKKHYRCVNAHKHVFFGGWNVRSCVKQSKKEMIIKQLKQYRIQIAALSETCMFDSGVKVVGDYTMIFSGMPHETKTRKAHGVAICLDPTATNTWKESGSEWEPISERIVKVRLQCKPIHITIIAVYSPINPTTKDKGEECDKFYSDLQDTIKNVPTNDMIIIIGDLNARVGQNQLQTTERSSVGPFTVDVENENGVRLVDFCEMNNLILSNTFFNHKTIHQTSWMHPRNKKWHILDYTIVNKKFRTSVEDVRMFRRAAGVIGTDHHLMRIKIRMHLKNRRKHVGMKRLNVDSTKLKDDKSLVAFQKDLSDIVDDAKVNEIDINDSYDMFVSQLIEKAKHHFPIDKNTIKKRKEWLTDDILKILDEKSIAFVNWQNHIGSQSEYKLRQKYKNLRKIAKKVTQKRQTEYWDEVCEEIEKSVKANDTATAFSIIRRLKGGSKRFENMPIQDKDGRLLTNSNDSLKRWCEFFQEQLNVISSIDQDLIDEIYVPTLTKTEEHRQSTPPSINEIRKALNQMKSRKAPGSDGVTIDILKAGGEPVIRWLFKFFTDVWEKEETTKEWSVMTLIKLYKNKGDKKVCDNYRGIALLNTTSKIFSRIILNRIQTLIDNQLLEIQAGFRSNRSTMDQIFILKMTMERRKEFNKPLHMCFIDITKAYDSVNRELLWKVCLSYGISKKLVNLLKMLYKDSTAKVRLNGELSDGFQINTGVMQGGIPSPILFNILFDFIVRKAIEDADVTGVTFSYGSNEFFHKRNEKHDKFHILALLYADDLVAMCETTEDLQKFIRSFEKVTQQFGLVMSIKKTCLMSLQQLEEDQHRKILKGKIIKDYDIDICIRNQKIETADSFTYLGCTVTNDQRQDVELSMRLAKAAKAFNMLRHVVWHRKSISITAKFRIFRACVLPVLLYGSEIWALTIKQEKRVASFYYKCLRTIININLGDRMSNEKLLEITGQPTIENVMRRNRLRWFGHINRCENENGQPSLIKKTMFAYFHGEKRPANLGRIKRWEDKILKDISELNIINWRKICFDRSRWREIINEKVYTRPIHKDVKDIVYEYKQRAALRRKKEATVTPNIKKRKITELLVKMNNRYSCPGCMKNFKAQGINNHVKACSKANVWRKKHNIK